jgi:hypothetical protein
MLSFDNEDSPAVSSGLGGCLSGCSVRTGRSESPHLGGSMLSPLNVLVSKVCDTQSDATYYHPEQDIIETHNDYSLAIDNYFGFISVRWRLVPT